MKISKFSIIFFAALAIGTVNTATGAAETGTTAAASTPASPALLQGGAIGIVENVTYDEDSFKMPRNGVIVGKNSIGLGQPQKTHPYGAVIVGNNSVIGGGQHPVLIGSNSVDMSTNGILVGSDSHVGASLRWKDANKKIHEGPENEQEAKGPLGNAPTNTLVLGNETSVQLETTVLSLGNKNHIHGSSTVALGHGSYVNTNSTAVGCSSYAIAPHSIALGMGTLANRTANHFGYNPATGQAYTFDDYADELDEQTINTLKELDSERIALEKALINLKAESDQATRALKKSHEKMANTVFESPEEKNAFLEEYRQLDAAQTEAYNNYVQSEEYSKLRAVNSQLTAEADHAALTVKASAGAASIGWDEYYTRQLTNLAAGSADTDAVNVKQLKDLRNYANNRIEAVEQGFATQDGRISAVEHGLAAQNSRLNKMDKKLERGLAANAALAGLMQPYNVKKFNITVGLGGYRSATAIAAGAGYRFSNNAAVKAGIATNTANFDDLSYNVSTAFEF